MPGGIMQLVAYGAEDLYLTGNPQITYFKLVYRRHTNFAMEDIELYFTTMPGFSTTQRTKLKTRIDRFADLVWNTRLVYDLPNINSTPEENFKWVRYLGHNIIHSVEISVSGQRLDIQYGQWMNVWIELTVTDSLRPAYDRMTGHYSKLRPGFGSYYPNKGTSVQIPRTRLIIPFEFWFCKNPGLAIPLIALQYTELFIYVEFNPLNDLFTIGKNNLSPSAFFTPDNCDDPLQAQLISQGFDTCNVYSKFANTGTPEYTFVLANYIYLDEDERRKFAQSSHEYLMFQVQRRLYTGLTAGNHIVDLDMFHPIKELQWVLQKNNVDILNDWNNYTFVDLFHDYYELKKEYYMKFDFLNNQADIDFLECTNEFVANIERNPQPNVEPNFLGCDLSPFLAFNDYTNIMLSAKLIFNGHDRFEERSEVYFNSLQPYEYHTHAPPPGIYVYSFAIEPESEQPSGTSNFSRINEAQLQVCIRRDLDPLMVPDGNDPDADPEVKFQEYNLYVYGINYNVFRIMGGIGQLAFSD